MRKLILCITMMLALGVNNSNAQATVYDPITKTYKESRSSRQLKDTLVTSYIYEDAFGHKYPIICNKKSGSCYIMKKSGKTGKLYRRYLPKDIAMQVCKNIGVAYKPAKK